MPEGGNKTSASRVTCVLHLRNQTYLFLNKHSKHTKPTNNHLPCISQVKRGRANTTDDHIARSNADNNPPWGSRYVSSVSPRSRFPRACPALFFFSQKSGFDEHTHARVQCMGISFWLTWPETGLAPLRCVFVSGWGLGPTCTVTAFTRSLCMNRLVGRFFVWDWRLCVLGYCWGCVVCKYHIDLVDHQIVLRYFSFMASLSQQSLSLPQVKSSQGTT